MFDDWKERIKDNPQINKVLLWDIDRSKMTDDDLKRMKLLVVQRVVELGNENDYYAACRLYGGKDGVREIIKQIRSMFSPIDEAFVRTVFNLKKEDLICYERKRLREAHLNS